MKSWSEVHKQGSFKLERLLGKSAGVVNQGNTTGQNFFGLLNTCTRIGKHLQLPDKRWLSVTDRTNTCNLRAKANWNWEIIKGMTQLSGGGQYLLQVLNPIKIQTPRQLRLLFLFWEQKNFRAKKFHTRKGFLFIFKGYQSKPQLYKNHRRQQSVVEFDQAGVLGRDAPARKVGMAFTKRKNCLTTIPDRNTTSRL